MPWPISALFTMTVTTLALLMRMKAFGANSRRPRRRASGRAASGDAGQPEAQQDAARQGRGCLQEARAGTTVRHRQAPFRIRAAASLIADRIRW